MEERLYKIYGRIEDLDKLEKALRHIEYLGEIGASRNVLIRVDGDGSGRIKVYKVLRGMIYEQEKIDKEQYNIKQTNQQAFREDIVGIYDIG
jgi:hypothetical protein